MKLLENKMKKLKLPRSATLLLALSSIVLNSCHSIPVIENPNVTLCVLDYPEGEGVCGRNGNSPPYRIPLSDLDHAVAFNPSDWKEVQTYIDYLEDLKEDNACR